MSVRYEVSGHVAVVTLDRPEKLNALTPQMGEEYTAALRRAGTDPEVRAVVVTGAGRGFCSGADLSGLSQVTESGAAPAGFLSASGLAPEAAREVGVPVLAAVNGAVAGVGFALMAWADLRFAAAGAQLSTTFARVGLVAEYGLSWLLPRLVGTATALDLLCTARTISAEEAAALGLVQRVLPAEELLPAALAWARGVATGCSPASLAQIKQQVYLDWSTDAASAVADSRRRMAASFTRPDLAEALAARREGRPPQFPPAG